ncbi:DEAD/DEAH box helicase [Mesoterricola silvestris]|uniref:Helicase n=1 Tax=Mesoterricola silvestris TaxID=2927979 RepID=A0AA48GE52_9BACT|nr:DEAD/DEAH box helicase [Mesoterricola silvestris]BDU70856.1 hypothetical protein METEAL_00300 [Mesoterricola silvestris]
MGEFTFRLRSEPSLEARHKAFPFQGEAVEFVTSRDYAAIFHEQGLGKTKIAIDAMLMWLQRKEVDTILIFTKKGLIANWQREFKSHTSINPLVVTENTAKNYYVFTTPCRVILSHFEAAKKELSRFKAWAKSRRVAVIIDESAKIKNPESDLTKAFFELGPYFAKRLIMTGTPVANRPYDVWAQIFFLDQGAALGTDFKAFKKATDFTSELADHPEAFQAFTEALSEVNRKLAPISLRETKDSGRIILPSKEFIRVDCDWEPAQFELYRQVREDLRLLIMRDGQLIEDDQESILKRLLRLIQIASNPSIIDGAYSLLPGKFNYLYDLLTDITRQGEKAIVWTNFNENCEWLNKQLAPFGALPMNGRMNMERRNASINWFLERPENQVLVATPGTAKEGLTLTNANHVIFYDRTYSLDDYLQSQDRIHRVSQTRTCYVYNLIMLNSVDEWVDALLEEKRLAAQITQGDITAAAYAEQASLQFFDILKQILGREDSHS